MKKLMARLVGALVAFVAVAVAAPAPSRAGLDPVNLAYLRTSVRQSSELGGGAPTRAVDGNVDGDWWHGSVTHTDYNHNPWWEVDLGAVRQLGKIEIYNRADCCAERIAPFVVIVSDVPIDDTDATVADAAMRGSVMRTRIDWVASTYAVPVNRSGRYVRITVLGDTWLHLAEVKVLEAYNAALGRDATQSTTNGGGVATRANDGDTSALGGSVTSSQYRPWWQVDLASLQQVREVHVWSRDVACCATSNPRKGFWLWTSASPFLSDPMVSPPLNASAVYVSAQGWPAIVPVNLDAQYVRVVLDGTDSLSMSEVQVWTMARGSSGGHASQSSFAPGSSVASAAIDQFQQTVSTSTNTETEPYWDLDLGGNRHIDSLKVWTGPGSTLVTSPYNIFVSNQPFVDAAGAPVKTVAGMRALPSVSSWVARGNAGGPSTTAIMRPARFVRLMMDGQNAITDLREVEVVSPASMVIGMANGVRQVANPLIPSVGMWGYVSQPGAPVYAYSWVRNASGGGGYYSYVAYASASTTPTMTPYANGPLYLFNMGSLAIGASDWPQGGVTGVYLEAALDGGYVFAPLRTWDENLGESPFWPDLRGLSIVPTPDDNASTRPKYLQSPWGAALGQYDYYARNFGYYTPPTLAAFKSTYFPAGATTTARFYNKNELGIGRGVTCARGTAGAGSPATICEIDHYGPADSAGRPIFGDEITSLNKLKTGTPISSVTVVKRDDLPYPVYGAYKADGTRTNVAEHDNARYNVYLPNNCMTCHGGSDSGPTNVHTATLLPFDPFAVTYTGTPYTQAEQRESFRKLNAMVLQSNPLPVVADFINGTYPQGVNVVNSQPDPGYVPGGWRVTPAQRRVYTEVIKPHCRTCHMSQTAAAGGLDMFKADDLEALRALVVLDACQSHRMPHAQQAMKQFWGSSARAYLLGFFGRHDFDGEGCAP